MRTTDSDAPNRSAEWQDLRDRHLRAEQPSSSAGEVHHLALLSSDGQRTIDVYQGVPKFI